jgi:hypothetical protein
LRIRMRWRLQYRSSRALLHYAAEIHDCNTVRDGSHGRKIMGDERRGMARRSRATRSEAIIPTEKPRAPFGGGASWEETPKVGSNLRGKFRAARLAWPFLHLERYRAAPRPRPHCKISHGYAMGPGPALRTRPQSRVDPLGAIASSRRSCIMRHRLCRKRRRKLLGLLVSQSLERE